MCVWRPRELPHIATRRHSPTRRQSPPRSYLNKQFPFHATMRAHTYTRTVRPLSVDITFANQPLSSDRPYEMECEASGSRPPAKITWWMGGIEQSGLRQKVSAGEYVFAARARRKCDCDYCIFVLVFNIAVIVGFVFPLCFCLVHSLSNRLKCERLYAPGTAANPNSLFARSW